MSAPTRVAGDARDRILEAACDVIAEQGIDDVRIARIATLAGVSPPLVHYHFATREALLGEALEHSFELLGDLRTTHADDEGWTAGRRLAWMIDQSLPFPGMGDREWGLWLELWRQAARRAELRAVAARLYERYEDWFAEVVEARDRRRRVRRGRPAAGRAAARRRDRRRRPARPGRRPPHGPRARARAGRGAARGPARDDAGGVRARMTDVLVLGAGLAGLAAARDLARAGADVLVLEARDRPGGRVERVVLEDGRSVQMGGELIGDFHTAYLGLAAELGLEPEPSYVAEPGLMSWDLAEGTGQGDYPPFFTPADVADAERFEARVAQLAATVDPADPWSHPDAARLDALSFAGWLRAEGARPAVIRLHDLGALSMGGGSIERQSMLGQLRMTAAAGAEEVYGYDRWEGLRLRDGSAALPLAMAAELGERVRYGAPVVALHAGSPCRVTLAGGEELRAEAIVCALPVGPLRDVAVSGVSDARLASLHRQRQALAAKVVAAFPEPVWRPSGANGLADSEGIVGSTWPQGGNALSMLVGPERLAHFLAAPEPVRRAEVLATLVRLYGDAAGEPDALLERHWGVDPFTQGYITQWAPGDVCAVGPLHGTHEPPFYVCGSDHWVAGYMEGAVRTGRAAAAAALGATSATAA